MKRIILIVAGMLAVVAGASAQTTAEIDRALAAAPRQMREEATVIK